MKQFRISVLLALTVLVGLLAAGCGAAGQNGSADAPSDPVSAMYAAKNTYLGDNAADGALLRAVMDYYQEDTPYTIELTKTVGSEQEDVLEIHFARQPQVLGDNEWDAAAILLALIDNCQQVTFVTQDSDGEVRYEVTAGNVGEGLEISDIKQCGASEQAFRELLTRLGSEEEAAPQGSAESPS